MPNLSLNLEFLEKVRIFELFLPSGWGHRLGGSVNWYTWEVVIWHLGKENCHSNTGVVRQVQHGNISPESILRASGAQRVKWQETVGGNPSTPPYFRLDAPPSQKMGRGKELLRILGRCLLKFTSA